MRRFLAVLIALLALPLVAASPNVLLSKPSVIVFPFTANGSTIDREASSRLATIIATQMANSGQVSVIPPPAGTERKDFLSVARAQRADYYIAGYISPLGTGVSVVEQVVSTSSGIVVFSNTAQLTTYADAAGQGDDLATFLSRHANRGLAAIGTPPPASSPSPAPSAEAQANLNKIFRRKKAATPAPKATQAARAPAGATAAPPATIAVATPQTIPSVPSAARPTLPPSAAPTILPTASPAAVAAHAEGAGIAVVPVGGPADAALRDAATERLIARAHAERVADAGAACTEHPRETVLSGTLAVRNDTTYGGASANFELVAKTCDGKTLWSKSYSNDAGGIQAAQLAMERVVDAAVGAYLNPPKPRRR